MSVFAKDSVGNTLLVVDGPSGRVGFIVDDEDVPFLYVLGNWHARYKVKPEAVPPVLRRRSPLTGVAVEIRLPLAIGVLRSVPFEERMTLATDWLRFVTLTKSLNVQWKPSDYNPQNCRWDNWNKEFVPPLVGKSLVMDYDPNFVPPVPDGFLNPEDAIPLSAEDESRLPSIAQLEQIALRAKMAQSGKSPASGQTLEESQAEVNRILGLLQ
jgi:hypothetical protein